MPNPWHFFMDHWLSAFWAMILSPFLFIAAVKVTDVLFMGAVKVNDEIRFRIERRRYRRSIKP